MNQSLTLAIGMLVGTVLAAINGLHAQGKTPGAYAILDISKILDPGAVPQIVAKAVPATKAAGGQYLAATEKITALSGNPPKRVAILAFDSVDQGPTTRPLETRRGGSRRNVAKFPELLRK